MTSRRSVIGAAALTAASYSKILGANDRVRLGVSGAGGRGIYVMKIFQKEPGVEVAAVCDVYGKRIDEALTSAPGARSFTDHRKLVEMKDLDAVLIGTPDHWHAAQAIDAMNAGKDVYVEKPLTLRREEGPQIVRAARVNNRICQVGMQQRSGKIYLEAQERFIRTGRLGKVTVAKCIWHGGPARPFRPTVSQKPANLDWDRFLGQVKWREWNPYMYFNYRAFLPDFGGGKITDLFTHWVDVVHMYLEDDGPVSATAVGGIYHDFKDGRTAPDTIHLMLQYRKGFTVTFESTALPNMPDYHIEFLGTEGMLWISRHRYEFLAAEKGAVPEKKEIPGDITADHVQNFLECCRTRCMPTADAYIGHRSVQASHLCVQSYLDKRTVRFDPDREEILTA
ncbi:MAG: Gfo/Idh/MocA family oxidoreductase [Bryobacteraceae bacterium]|nr:Gfo/Idh/MocA family oxidoreductase [Bryobacteraceae bacterium]